jgi:hypothetical protein
MSPRSELIVKALLDRCGRPYADEAGIKLADRPGPLYQLLVLSTLLSAPISGDIAMAAARELFAAGYRSPKAMSEAGWQDRVDALDRAHYRRYDERTATALGDGADLLSSRWHGDLRKLRDQAGGDADGIASLLTELPGLGPAGASIFLREVQHVWPTVAPYVDGRDDQRGAPGGAPGQPAATGPGAVRQRPARPARRRPGAGVAEPAHRQRSHRRCARLRPPILHKRSQSRPAGQFLTESCPAESCA